MIRVSHSLAQFGGRVALRAQHWPAAAAQFLVRYRIRLSAAIFGALVLQYMFQGLKPHDVTNLLDLQAMAGVGLMLLGLGLRSWAAGVLHKLGEVTNTGPYKLIRHPLYVGSLSMMVGTCLILGDYAILAVMLGFVALVYTPQVWSEEQILAQQFSSAWTAYAAATGRFLPRRLWCDVSANWKFSQWVKNREYEALLATALGLAAFKAWLYL